MDSFRIFQIIIVKVFVLQYFIPKTDIAGRRKTLLVSLAVAFAGQVDEKGFVTNYQQQLLIPQTLLTISMVALPYGYIRATAAFICLIAALAGGSFINVTMGLVISIVFFKKVIF